MNVVITGASRGIGLELVHQALAKGHRVLAVARKPDESPGLQELKVKFANNLSTVAADVGQDGAPAQIVARLKDWECVDVLINNAGIFRKDVSSADFAESFRVNSVAPFLTTQALLPLLKKSKRAKAAHITSKMGSISDNQSGGYYAYRASKAALNMINKSLAEDHDFLTTIVVHPGWVKTDMGGAGATVEIVDSARGIWKTIETSGAEQSGQFFNYDGSTIAW